MNLRTLHSYKGQLALNQGLPVSDAALTLGDCSTLPWILPLMTLMHCLRREFGHWKDYGQYWGQWLGISYRH